MTRLSEEETREFLNYLDRIDDDMTPASTDASELDSEEFTERWGNYPSRLLQMIERDNYRGFVENAYLNDDR
jgi:hypothetical protein